MYGNFSYERSIFLMWSNIFAGSTCYFPSVWFIQVLSSLHHPAWRWRGHLWYYAECRQVSVSRDLAMQILGVLLRKRSWRWESSWQIQHNTSTLGQWRGVRGDRRDDRHAVNRYSTGTDGEWDPVGSGWLFPALSTLPEAQHELHFHYVSVNFDNMLWIL